MKCPRCEADAPSDAEFCPQCGAKLIVACAQCGTGNAPQHSFCKKCGVPLARPGGPGSGAMPRLAPETYTPRHLAERILTSRSALEGERKQVTVFFADLKGSMELLADHDPEEARKLLDPVLEHMMEAVHRYEGTVNQVMGDGIMALFGAPLAHEDHAVRACYAAPDMQGAIRRYAEEVRRAHGAKVQIRVGLNSGEVIVRAIGSDLHMDYTAVGQTTHLAAQPLLIVFEDLHRIDAETQGLLDSFVESVPTARLLLLVNYRPEYEHRWAGKTYYTQLRLDPLPPESAEELLRALMGEDAELIPLARRLVERTEGNPFFLEESVRVLVETGALAGERGHHRLAVPLPEIRVPASVQAVLAARMDRLPPEDRQLLQEAAVIGKDVPLALLRAATELPEEDLRRRLAHLQAGEFLYETSLYPDPEYTFKHALTQEVAYGGLLHERRRTLHARIAGALKELAGERWPDHAEALARHARNGEVWEVAVDCLREAGLRAFARGAVGESLERLEAALDLLSRLPPGPETTRRAIDVRCGLLQPFFLLGQAPRFARLMHEARQLALDLGDRTRLARVLLGLSACANIAARYGEVLDAAGRALAISTADSDADLRIGATYTLATARALAGDTRAAVDLFTPLVDGADAERARRNVSVFGTVFIGSCTWLGCCWAYLGDFARAVEYAERGLKEADEIGVPFGQASASAWRVFPLVLKGEASQALPWLERAVRLSEENGLVAMFAMASSWLGWALAMSGRPAEALPLLERGVSGLERAGLKMALSHFHTMWAQALLLAGQIEAAERTAERALDLAVTCGERVHQAMALEVQAEIQSARQPPGVDLAASLYERAAGLAREIGLRPMLARCHLGLGRLHRIAGRHEPAREQLVAAIGMFREMGMQSWLAQAEAELWALG